MADKGGLQLLPETRKRIEITVPGENRNPYIGAAIVALVFLGVLGLKFYASNLDTTLADLDSQLASQESRRDKKAEAALSAVSKQMAVMKALLSSHLFWSDAFSRIDRLYQNQVRLKNFNATATPGSLKLSAVASSYTVVARQIASFLSDDGIVDVNVSNIKTNQDGTVEFSMELILDPQKLLLRSMSGEE